MIDLSLFKSLLNNEYQKTPIHYYFHENQYSYPWDMNNYKSKKGIETFFGIFQLRSCLVADKIYFNSEHNRKTFTQGAIEEISKQRDDNDISLFNDINKKIKVLPLGIDFTKFDVNKLPKNEFPTIVWNHRWEKDKNLDDAFQLLKKLKQTHDFKLYFLGQSPNFEPPIINEIKSKLGESIAHIGHVNDFSEYCKMLWKSHISLSTSNHDFFGISTLETMYCGCYPILPLRNAYPEHFHSVDHLYKNSYEAFEKLKYAVENYKNLTVPGNKVENYKWSNIIEIYDQELSEI